MQNIKDSRQDIQEVFHPFKPVFNSKSRILILGSFPSPLSRKDGFYYGNRLNRFWKVLAAVFAESIPDTREEKTDMILRHHLALWDVISYCQIKGADDSSIKNVRPNNIASLVKSSSIDKIMLNGSKAFQLYKRYVNLPLIPYILLHSTSPADASHSLNDLIDEYKILKEADK
jgi:hypoxanthine-DNA glycosylase